MIMADQDYQPTAVIARIMPAAMHSGNCWN
jgi:hypothetical protein